MLKIYGTMFCPDCVECCECLDREGISYEFLDISSDLRNLKQFLSIRDGSALFDPVREAGSIGIPAIVDEEGNVSLSWEGYVSQDRS